MLTLINSFEIINYFISLNYWKEIIIIASIFRRRKFILSGRHERPKPIAPETWWIPIPDNFCTIVPTVDPDTNNCDKIWFYIYLSYLDYFFIEIVILWCYKITNIILLVILGIFNDVCYSWYIGVGIHGSLN